MNLPINSPINSQRPDRWIRLVCTVAMWAVAMLISSGVRTGLKAAPPQAPANSAGKLTITTKSLPNATVGVEYYAVIAATGGAKPIDFSGTGLPAGLAFHDFSDTIGGKATTPGIYSVVITARDSTMPTEQTATVTLKLTVVAAKK